MTSPSNLKVFKRAVTSIAYKWDDFDYGQYQTYRSPIFPADPTQVGTVSWQVELDTHEENSSIALSLNAFSKHTPSLRFTFAFDIQYRHGLSTRKVSVLKVYQFETDPEKATWKHIGGWISIYPDDDRKALATPISILCTIDIVNEENEAPVDALFYTIPPCALWQNLETLLATGKDADVTLVSKDKSKKIKAHKVILMARSSVFNAMFSSEMSENLNKLAVLGDLDGEVLDELVRFIYTGKVSSNVSTIANRLLLAADKYDLPILRAICEQEIGINLSVEKAAEALVLADLFHASQLKKHTLRFIVLHAQQVMATEGWQDIKAKYPNLAFDVCESLAMLQPLDSE